MEILSIPFEPVPECQKRRSKTSDITRQHGKTGLGSSLIPASNADIARSTKIRLFKSQRRDEEEDTNLAKGKGYFISFSSEFEVDLGGKFGGNGKVG